MTFSSIFLQFLESCPLWDSALLGNPKLLLMCVLTRHFPAPVTGRDRIRVKQDQETESGFSLGGRGDGGGGRGGMQPPRGTHNLGLESVKDPSHPTVQVRNFMAIPDSTFSHPSRPIKNQLQLSQAAGHSTSSSMSSPTANATISRVPSKTDIQNITPCLNPLSELSSTFKIPVSVGQS